MTDSGLKELAACKSLRNLALFDTKVTIEGVKALEDALPQCIIVGP